MSRNDRKRWAGVCCITLAISLCLWAIGSLIRRPSYADYSGINALHLVGLFVPAVVALIAGVWLLWANPKQS